mgnify:CR=1 FL=1
MKRKVLAILVPALLVAGAANAAEIYNKNGNKLDFYGKMVGEHIMTHDGGNNNSDDTSYARFGVKGETQRPRINTVTVDKLIPQLCLI